MNSISTSLFNQAENVLNEALNQRLQKHNLHLSNIANSETPGYRARGYEFEAQLQDVVSQQAPLRATHSHHFMNENLLLDGQFKPEIFIKPSESIGNDGNSVDVETEMSDLAANQIMYRAAADIISKKMALMKYAITGGR